MATIRELEMDTLLDALAAIIKKKQCDLAVTHPLLLIELGMRTFKMQTWLRYYRHYIEAHNPDAPATLDIHHKMVETLVGGYRIWDGMLNPGARDFADKAQEVLDQMVAELNMSENEVGTFMEDKTVVDQTCRDLFVEEWIKTCGDFQAHYDKTIMPYDPHSVQTKSTLAYLC